MGMAEEGLKEGHLRWAETLIFHMHSIPHRRNYKGFEPLEMATSADAFEDFVAPPSLTHQLRQFRSNERKKI